jgi:hypothetical protein
MAHHGRHGKHGKGIVGVAVSGEVGSRAGNVVNGGGRVGCFVCVSFFLAAEERGKTRKIAWGRELRPPKGVSGSARASPSEDRSQHLGRCSLHLRTGFRVEPFFWPRKNAEERGKSHGHGGGLFQPRKTRFSVFSGWWLPCVAGFTGVVAVLRCFGLVAIA